MSYNMPATLVCALKAWFETQTRGMCVMPIAMLIDEYQKKCPWWNIAAETSKHKPGRCHVQKQDLATKTKWRKSARDFAEGMLPKVVTNSQDILKAAEAKGPLFSIPYVSRWENVHLNLASPQNKNWTKERMYFPVYICATSIFQVCTHNF